MYYEREPGDINFLVWLLYVYMNHIRSEAPLYT